MSEEEANVTTLEREEPVTKPERNSTSTKPELNPVNSKLEVDSAKEFLDRLEADSAKEFLDPIGASHFEKERRLRRNLSRYLILMISSLCMYTFFLGHIRNLNKIFPSASYVTLALTIIFVVSVAIFTLSSGYKLERFGITLRNWKPALIESILFTIPVLIAMTLIKWAIIQFIPEYHHQILFDFHASLHPDLRGTPHGHQVWFITLLLYAFIGAPLQELISRGGVQSGLSLFLSGKHRNLIAILLTTVVFSTAHLAFPIQVVTLSFLAGLFWGWLFYRHKTLVGVSVSHAMIGVWFFWLLGVFT